MKKMKTKKTGKGSTLLLILYVTMETTLQETNLEVESHSETIESLSLSKKLSGRLKIFKGGMG